MSKKTIIIASIAALLILAAGGFYLYKNNLLPFVGNKLTPEKLLVSFENKNPNLTSDVFRLFQDRFKETKDTLQKNLDDFDSWLYLGVLKKGIGDYEGARDVFIYAGQIRPQSSTPFANLADLYAYFLNEPAKAEASLKQAITNDADDYNLYLSLADIYRYKFADGAVKYEQTMLEAITKFPDNPNLIAPLASFYRETSQTVKAIEWYEKLVKLAPDNAEAKKDLADLKAKQ